MNMKKIIPVILLSFSLTGCSSIGNFFSDKKDAPLTGERVALFAAAGQEAYDTTLQSEAIELPSAWTNEVWPQSGGYPNHAMGHLTLGRDLKRAWKVPIGAGGYRRNPLISQPVVAEGKVFALDSRSRVSAFAIENGKQVWRTSVAPKDEDDDSALGGGLAYAGGRLYATNGYKQLLAIDPKDGKTLWTVAVPSIVRSAPTAADGRVYVSTLDGKLVAYAAADGALLWSFAGVTETTSLLGSIAPAVQGPLVVMPMASGDVLGLRPENGQPVWTDNLSTLQRSTAIMAISDIRGQPVIDRNVVYAASFSGRMVALDAISGQRIWQRDIASAETPWSAEGAVFVITSDQKLMALARASGGTRWAVDLPRFEQGTKGKAVVWTGPVLAGGRLILASSGGKMLEVDPLTGKTLRETKLPRNVMVPPVVAQNTLFLLTEFGELCAYR